MGAFFSRGKAESVFGAHDIGFIGGLSLLTNNILGSGMLQIPSLYQQAGWVIPTAVFLVVACWTCVAALYLGRTITKVPGNADFGQRVEYSLLMRSLLPRWLYLVCFVFLIGSFIASNISNIIVSSQVADDILLVLFKRTCALVLYPAQSSGSQFICVDYDSGNTQVQDSPFGIDVYTVSIGWLLIAALTLPLSYLNLDNNVVFQVAGVAVIIVCVAVWTAQFFALGLSAVVLPAFASAESVAASGTTTGGTWWITAYSSVIPTVLFNYGFVCTVPSWCNEKGPSISVTSTVVGAVLLSTGLYLALGLFGALSPLNFGSGADLLTLLVGGSVEGIWALSQVCAFIFPAAALVVSIPVFSVLVRYNMVNAGASVWAAQSVAVLLPWALSLVFYAGDSLTELINWSSALLFAVVNLVVPVALYLQQRRLIRAAAADAGLVAASSIGGGAGVNDDDDDDIYDAAPASVGVRASLNSGGGGDQRALMRLVALMGGGTAQAQTGSSSAALVPGGGSAAAAASLASRLQFRAGRGQDSEEVLVFNPAADAGFDAAHRMMLPGGGSSASGGVSSLLAGAAAVPGGGEELSAPLLISQGGDGRPHNLSAVYEGAEEEDAATEDDRENGLFGLSASLYAAGLPPLPVDGAVEAAALLVEDIRPTPACCRRRLSDRRLAWALLGLAVFTAALAVALQTFAEYQADTSPPSSSGDNSTAFSR